MGSVFVQVPEQCSPVLWGLCLSGCLSSAHQFCGICVFQVPEQYGPVRTLSQGKGALILIGTTKNCILQGSLDLEFSPIIQVMHSLMTFPRFFFFLSSFFSISKISSNSKS